MKTEFSGWKNQNNELKDITMLKDATMLKLH